LRYLSRVPNIIRVIRSWSMRWEGHVARTGDNRNAYRGLVEKYEAKRPHGRRGIAGRKTLNRIIKKWDWTTWAGSVWLRVERGGELLWIRRWTYGFHKTRGISWQNYKLWLLKKAFTPWR